MDYIVKKGAKQNALLNDATPAGSKVMTLSSNCSRTEKARQWRPILTGLNLNGCISIERH